MKKTILFTAILLMTGAAFAQKKTSTSATVSFDATTSLDELPKADNNTVVAKIDTKTGEVAFEALVKSFSFGNPMMQDHFNSAKWLDSQKFPTTTFKGKITNLKELDLTKDGTYSANVEGNLSLHGITKPIKTTATLVVNGKTINSTSDFTFKLSDYGVGDAGGKVAKEPKITVKADLK